MRQTVAPFAFNVFMPWSIHELFGHIRDGLLTWIGRNAVTW